MLLRANLICTRSLMSFNRHNLQASPPDSFVVEVFSEIGQDTIQRRWREVNVLLRLSMLTGLPMQMDAALSMLCDFASLYASPASIPRGPELIFIVQPRCSRVPVVPTPARSFLWVPVEPVPASAFVA